MNYRGLLFIFLVISPMSIEGAAVINAVQLLRLGQIFRHLIRFVKANPSALVTGTGTGISIGVTAKTILDAYEKVQDEFALRALRDFFPIKLTVGYNDIFMHVEDFNAASLFSKIGRLLDNKQLRRICFYGNFLKSLSHQIIIIFFGPNGSEKEVKNDDDDMGMFLMYAIMNAKKLALFECDH